MAVPKVVLGALLWLIRYAFLPRTMDYIARNRARRDPKSLPCETLGAYNRGSEIVMRSGESNDPEAFGIA
jgi:hypothetical protein